MPALGAKLARGTPGLVLELATVADATTLVELGKVAARSAAGEARRALWCALSLRSRSRGTGRARDRAQGRVCGPALFTRVADRGARVGLVVARATGGAGGAACVCVGGGV